MACVMAITLVTGMSAIGINRKVQQLHVHRKHCAHKTHRLRSSLKMTHGKGRDFKPLPKITPESTKDGQYVPIVYSDVSILADFLASNFFFLRPREPGLLHRNCLHRMNHGDPRRGIVALITT